MTHITSTANINFSEQQPALNKTPDAKYISSIVDEKAKEGPVFIIVAGINKYDPAVYGPPEDVSLNYCVNDANSYDKYFSDRKKTSKHWKNVRVLKLTDDQATTENLKKLFKAAGAKNPSLVMFINSSHGTNDGTRPYLCMHDRPYSMDELTLDRNRYFADSQFISILDSCYSGGFAAPKDAGPEVKSRFWEWKDKSTAAFNAEKFVKNDKLIHKGDIVIASCKFNQTSIELPFFLDLKKMPDRKNGHGLFSGSFLKAGHNPKWVDRGYGNDDGTASFEENFEAARHYMQVILNTLFPDGGFKQDPQMLDSDLSKEQPLIDVKEIKGGGILNPKESNIKVKPSNVLTVEHKDTPSLKDTRFNFPVLEQTSGISTVKEDQSLKHGRKFVLVIGIDDYIYNVPDLSCCENDANGIVQCLGDKWEGAAVTRLLSRNATKANIMNWFVSLKDQLKANDQVFIAYSGHGTNDGYNGYLCPADTKSNSISSLISGDELAEWRTWLGPAVVSYTIDSCFSGKIPEDFDNVKKPGDYKVPSNVRYLPMEFTKSNFNQDYFYAKLLWNATGGYRSSAPTIILTASSADQYSQEDPNLRVEGLPYRGYGAFMGWLMKGLGVGDATGYADKNQDKNISMADEAYKWTYEAVSQKYRDQNPNVFYSGAYGGDWYNWYIKGTDPDEKLDSTGWIKDAGVGSPAVTDTAKTGKIEDKPKTTEEGNVFVLSIGVNRYDSLKYLQQYGTIPSTLKYCVNDARGVAGKFQGKLSPPENIALLEDNQATWANVQAQVAAIKQNMRPEDKLVIYSSSHGTNDGKDGYICLYDRMVSGTELGILSDIAGVDNQVAFIFDSCQNGALIGKGADEKTVIGEGAKYFKWEKSKDNFVQAQELLVKGLIKPNIFVFTSCKGDQYSSESPRLEHGLFTYALLQGMDEKNYLDYMKDGDISMEDLVRYASWRTYLLSLKPDLHSQNVMQYPQNPQYLDNDKEKEFVVKDLK
ncbi:MAG: caspase family protein [Armatimonadota bacterium]